MGKKKPKKGGMVLIIGMGGKPKDMKKAERRVAGRGSADAQAASRNKTHSRLRSGRLDIDKILGKRSINPENFHGEMQRRHGMDMEEYLSHDSAPFDIQSLIDELAEKSANERGQAKSSRTNRRAQSLRNGLTNPRITGMLRDRGITRQEWDREVEGLKDSELNDNTFSELLRKLAPEMSDDERKQLSNKADRIFRGQGGYDTLFDEVDRDNSGEVDTDKRSVHDMPLSESDPSGESDEEEKMQRLLQLFEARGSSDPMEDAMRAMHAMGGQASDPDKGQKTGTHKEIFNAPSDFTVPYRGSGERVQDSKASGKGRNPAGPAPPGSVEAEYYGFRGPSPIRGSGNEEPEEEDTNMDAVEQNMFRSSFDNPNVMDAAWKLLKGNPDMSDRGGKSVHPAAMNYAQYARALTDSLQYRDPQNEQERINLERSPLLWDMDKTQGQVPDRASATLFRNTAESKHPLAQSKLGGETMREHSDFARERAKRDTRAKMRFGGHGYGPDQHIVRMPRGTSNTQEESMDN